MGSPRPPRGPAVPRDIAQVGFGTTRDFIHRASDLLEYCGHSHDIPVASREVSPSMRMEDDSAPAFRRFQGRELAKEAPRPNKVEFQSVALHRGDDKHAATTESGEACTLSSARPWLSWARHWQVCGLLSRMYQ